MNRTRRGADFPRGAGVLLHPTSLPAAYGIGDLGPEAYRFVDFLVLAGQSVWQICPLGPTGYGDSPYQCFSSRAFNPLLVSPDLLAEDGLLRRSELEQERVPVGPVDFATVHESRERLLRSAWSRWRAGDGTARRTKGFLSFSETNAAWLEDYALFMVLKQRYAGAPWWDWPQEAKRRDRAFLDRLRLESDETEYQRFVQFQAATQWEALKRHANESGVRVIGDMPIFVSRDSADAWSRPDLFQFDDELVPTAVAGVPPDYFSPDGQLWGNPLYEWDAHRRNGYRWWLDVLAQAFSLYDAIRLDHFRGFAAYWRVPFGAPHARDGRWVTGPGRDLFDTVFARFDRVPIIAEDLGVITADVNELIEYCGFPRMKILQFAFDSKEENDYLPHTYDRNSVVYTGTHDNDTVTSWYSSALPEDRRMALSYLASDGREVHWDFIRAAYASVAQLAIVPAQDVLGLGTEARMNTPGTVGGRNWRFRLAPGSLTPEIARRLADLSSLYGRARRPGHGEER